MNFLPIHWLFGWLFAQYLFAFFKSLLLNYFLKRSSLYIVESFSLQISNQQPMNISVTGKKVKFIWIHNHTIILNPQGKPIFFNCINFYNLYTYIYIYIYTYIYLQTINILIKIFQLLPLLNEGGFAPTNKFHINCQFCFPMTQIIFQVFSRDFVNSISMTFFGRRVMLQTVKCPWSICY